MVFALFAIKMRKRCVFVIFKMGVRCLAILCVRLNRNLFYRGIAFFCWKSICIGEKKLGTLPRDFEIKRIWL